MIKMIDFGGQLCPVVECDRCDGLVTDIGSAVAVFGPSIADYSGPIEFRHKGACFPMGERRPWRPLREFLDQLRNNVESDPRTDPELVAVEQRLASRRVTR